MDYSEICQKNFKLRHLLQLNFAKQHKMFAKVG